MSDSLGRDILGFHDNFLAQHFEHLVCKVIKAQRRKLRTVARQHRGGVWDFPWPRCEESEEDEEDDEAQ